MLATRSKSNLLAFIISRLFYLLMSIVLVILFMLAEVKEEAGLKINLLHLYHAKYLRPTLLFNIHQYLAYYMTITGT